MNRLLLGVLMVLSAVEAQEVETGLAAVRQRLRGHAVAQRKLSGLQHRAALVSGTLGETAAAIERSEGQDLGYLRERLLIAARSLEADFASIDAKLAGLGLPDKTAAWREFVRHYRGSLAEADGELAALAASAGGLSRQQLRARLAALRGRFGGGGGVLESVKVPERVEAADRPEAFPTLAADDAPVPGDLAQSSVVLLTAEIRAQAAALDGIPLNLYNWVATQVEYVPYLGQMQNSLSVLWSHRGNDFDQATLLIALLRASGVPARYVCADVVMPRADVRDWMEVKDESILLGLLSRGLGFSLFPLVEPDKVVASRVWVEAYLDTGGGKGWLTLDPARKRRSYQPGIVLPRPSYDRMAYLKASKPVLPAEPYLDLLRADLQKRFPGRGFNEVPYTGTLLPPPPPTAEAPYPVVKLQFRTSEVPAVLRHKINLSLTEYGRQTRYLSVDLSLPEIVLQSLTLSYIPATAADRQVAEAFGGLEGAPAAVVNLIPEIRLQGQVIASGKTPLPAATAMDLTVTHIPVAQGTTQYVSRNMHTAGETAAVVLGAHQVGEQLLADRISSFLDRLPAAPAAEATRRLLDVAALRYLHRLEIDKQRLSDALQVRFIQAAGVENAITFAGLEAQTLFDRPFVVTPGRLRIHANPTSLPLVDLNRSDQNDPVLKTAWQLHNDASSALEHEVWEELVMIPSASTIKILETAIRDKIPIRTVNRDNAAAEMRDIVAAASTKAAMQQAINAGATLTAPQRPVTIGALKWQGWIEEFANWSFAYRIDAASLTGPAPGGDTGGTPPPPRPPAQEPGTVGQPGPVNNTTHSDPVNVSNGNLFEQTTDYTLATPGPGIVFQRTYSSLSLADGPLGPGWRHNYQVSLKDSGSSLVIQDGSGAVLTFRQGSGAWVSPPGYNLKLTKDAQRYLLRTKKGVESRFDLRGILQSITDRNQNAIQFTYEADRLRRIADRAGRSVTLSYDSKGRITTLEDFSGRRVTYEYDAAGHLAAATDAGGNRTVYAYYTDTIYKNLLKSVTTPEGRATKWEYYGNGKVSRVINPDGRTVSLLYLPLRNETHVIDPQGLLTSYQYNSLGNVTRVLRPDGSALDSVYNADAKLEAQTDAAGYTTRYTYDAAGNLTSVTDPLGRAMRFTYDPVFNLATSIRDAGGNLTQFEYDARGNLTRVVDPLGAETRFTWDGSGNMTSSTDAEGNAATITYDSSGNADQMRDALGNVTKVEFDRLNRLTYTADALGGETRLEYDALDRVVRLVDQLGRATTTTYDREGRTTQTVDFADRTTKFGYDSMSHLTQVADALGKVTQYAYASADCGCTSSANLLVFRDAAGFTRSQTYDFQDRPLTTTDDLGYTNKYTYDARGAVARKVDADGGVITFEYDAAGRLTRKVFPDGVNVRFTYDEAGNLTAAINPFVTLTYIYDELNRVASVTDSRFQKTIRYSYNRLGQRTTMTDSEGGVTSYTRDARRQVTAITSPAGAVARFSYDALGRVTGVNYSNDTATSLQYDAAGRLLGLVHTSGSAAAPVAAFTYSYDNAGNPTSVVDRAGSHALQYDALNRLVGAQHPSLPSEDYSYDAAGNRTASATDPAYRYDSAGRLLAGEGATFSYDRDGNLARKTAAGGTTVYSWDGEDRLVRVALPNGDTVSYKYDPFGRRIEKDVNGSVTTYLYDGNSILLEMDAAGGMTARYTQGTALDWPLLIEREGRTWFYHSGALGSVAALTDSSGNVVRSYTYDSWGRPADTEGAEPANPFRFAGREYDSETGLYYVRARYYDPAVGRFISADPLDLPGLLLIGQSPSREQALLPQAAAWALRRDVPAPISDLGAARQRSPQGLNAYAYAANNPLALRDPSGLSPVYTGYPVHPGSGLWVPTESGNWEQVWGWTEEDEDRRYAEIWEKTPGWKKVLYWLGSFFPQTTCVMYNTVRGQTGCEG